MGKGKITHNTFKTGNGPVQLIGVDNLVRVWICSVGNSLINYFFCNFRNMDSVDGAKGVHVSSDESFSIDCDPCDYNQISKKAAAFCQECEEYLCELCKTAHEKLKLTRSHKLLSGELMPPKRSARKKAVLDTVLCSCMKNEVAIYCKEHDSLVCVNCGALHHRRCQTSDIGDISKDFDVDSTEETIANWNELNETLTSLADSREKDLSNLTLEAKDCRDKAKQFREELSIKLESMEAKTLSAINILETQETKTITQQLDTCKAAQNSLDKDRRNLIWAKERNDRQSIFVYNIQLSQSVKSLTTITDEITKEVYQPHISFECNPAITITGDKELGTVKCHTTRTPQQKDFDEMSVTARNQVNVKVPSDAEDAGITGSAFLPSGELILCDCDNNKLKLLDENLQMKESIDLPKAPWDIAVVNQHQVIVTFLCQQYLQFIQVTPSLALGHTVNLGMESWGVTVSRESIYISLLESGEGKIGIYDLTGKKKRIIGPYNGKDGKVLIEWPWYIAVSNDEKIFVSGESSTPTVYCLESSGNVLYTVSYPSFTGCSGISVDEDENLLVCDAYSHKVFLITNDGKEVREFLTEKDGLLYTHGQSASVAVMKLLW